VHAGLGAPPPDPHALPFPFLGKDVARQGSRIGDWAGFGLLAGSLGLGFCGGLVLGPALLAHQPGDEMGFEAGQRVARPFGGDGGFAFVGLGVLEAVALQAGHGEAEQGGAVVRADVIDGLADEGGGCGGVGAVAFEDGEAGEAREVGGDVAAWRLAGGGDGDAVAIVLDEEQHGQAFGGGDGQSRPEAVGGAGGIPAEGDGDRALVGGVGEGLAVIAYRLGPAGGGGELGADAAAHG
jgi:hypothetical protein